MKLSIDERTVTVGGLSAEGARVITKRAKTWATFDPTLIGCTQKSGKVTHSVLLAFKTKDDARDFAIAFLYRGGVPA